MHIDQQSKKDLEFDSICRLLSDYCKSNKAKELALNLNFFPNVDVLKSEFELLDEIQEIHVNDTLNFPHSNSEDIDGALKLLKVENGVLILDELIKIYALCIGTKDLIKFSKQNKETSPLVYEACSHIDSIDEVLTIIKEILDEKKLDIKDDASKTLYELRNQQKSNQKEVNKNFDKVLKEYRNEALLAETEETHLENRRLLAVLSQYKKRVKGRIVGLSSKGVVTYIEPECNVKINRNQEQLRIQEQHEIYVILERVTLNLRSQKHNLKAFQRLLVRFDVYNAKVQFADTYQGVKPKINRHHKMYWEDAKHPLLLIKNNELDLKTIGQQIELDGENRFLVISGPNAGGKSITLKTIGLVQMMFQSGLFLPLSSNSECCWFDSVLSDIGDNQSIENQLSTYSYRINRMQFFLESVNSNTLLLLDEFGSGSDPELGGALAEIFYEELYGKGVFAVITTHYTNIKILTASLPNAVNACMLFDTKKLKPLYELSVGQPGSSFTFEVAQFNGIPLELINKAKVKVSDSKVKIDQLTVDLQQEKSKFKKINSEQYRANSTARKKIVEYDEKLTALSKKATTQIQFFEQQNKFVNTGKKIYELIKKFKKHKTNKLLNEAIKKIVAIEKTKLLALETPVVFNQNLKAPNLPEVKNKEIAEILTEQIDTAAEKKQLKIGDKVKIKDQSKIGEVTAIKGKKATVVIGNFNISISTKELTSI
jgi:DNA mismatch repair protein MutS2